MGVAVRRYIDILIIIITFPYTPAKMMSRSIIVHTLLSLRILHSLEHSHFMGGFLAEYLGISSDVHHSLL